MAKIPANLARIRHRDILETIRESAKTSIDAGRWAGTEWAEFELIQDAPTILKYCSLDQFIVGRAAWGICNFDYGLRRLLDSYRFWTNYTEPDWFTNEVYLAKPGSIEVVAQRRAEYPPDWAMADFASFCRWEYQGDGRLSHHVAIASAQWLLDNGMTPEQIGEAGGAYLGAWRWGFDRLATITPPEALDISESTAAIPVEGLPLDKRWAARVKVEGPLPVLAILLCVASGLEADHNRWILPTVEKEKQR